MNSVFPKRFWKRFLNGKGSLLLEVAVALSVVGVISGFFITKSITMGRIAREQKTKNNVEIVTAALASYLAMHKRLPRPAVSNGSGITKGVEVSEFRCVVGTVPYNTLGIAKKNVLDGRGRPLIYVVDPQLTECFDSIYFDQNKFGDSLELPKFFCDSSLLSMIKIAGHLENGDMVAFVIDTADNIPQKYNGGEEGGENEAFVVIKPGPNTFWVHRNFLLTHYLKGCPCDREMPKDKEP